MALHIGHPSDEQTFVLSLLMKTRFPKPYRVDSLDTSIRLARTSREAHLLHDSKRAGVPTLETCAQRDPKGLHKKASAGQIKDPTGPQDLYEEPLSPDLIVDTEKLTESTARKPTIFSRGSVKLAESVHVINSKLQELNLI